MPSAGLRIDRHELPKRLLVGTPERLATLLGWAPQTRANTSSATPEGTCLWLAPDRWVVLGCTLPVQHAGSAAILDASSRWITLKLSGPHAADLIACGCSLDLRPQVFGVGACAQSRFEQVPVILFRRTVQDFDVLVERPLAQHLELWLREAAREFVQERP